MASKVSSFLLSVKIDLQPGEDEQVLLMIAPVNNHSLMYDGG